MDQPRRAGFTRIEFCVVVCILAVLIAILLPAVRQARDAARKSQWKSNLKNIGLAMGNYHDTYQSFPPGGIFGADGTAYHGWFTSIGGYYEAGRLPPWDFSMPWDDARQLEYFMKPHPIAIDPTLSKANSEDGLPLIHCAANEWLFHRNSSFKWDDVANKSGTMIVADSFGDFPPWARPYNWRDPTVPFRTAKSQFGGTAQNGTYVVFLDCSVKLVHPAVDPAVQAMWAGPPERKPIAAQVATPFRLPSGGYWKTETIYAVSVDGSSGEYSVKIRRDPHGIARRAFDDVCCKVDAPERWLCGPTPGDAVVEQLLKHSTLEEIELRHISDNAAKRLAQMPNLKRVHLTPHPVRFSR